MFYVAKCATVGLMYAHKHVGDFSILGVTKFGLESNGFRYVLSTTLAIKKMHVACLFKLM